MMSCLVTDAPFFYFLFVTYSWVSDTEACPPWRGKAQD